MEGDDSEPVNQDCENKETEGDAGAAGDTGEGEGEGGSGDAEQSSVESVDTSASKSSPFHGFSSQDEEAEEEEALIHNETEVVEAKEPEGDGSEVREAAVDNGLKSQLLADFGIGNEASEEEEASDNNLSENEKGEEKEELKSQLMADFGIENEASEEDENTEAEEDQNKSDECEENNEESELVMAEQEKETEVAVNEKQKEDKPEEEEMEVDGGEMRPNQEDDEGDNNQEVNSQDEMKDVEEEENNLVNEEVNEDDEEVDKANDDEDQLTQDAEMNEEADIVSKKVSPLRIGQLKSSPKKVHFSPEVVFNDQEANEEMEAETPKSSKTASVSQGQDTSPPLKLKIKFGKDKTGAITAKINTKAAKEESFHGFPDSEIPAWVCDNFNEVDLKTTFQIRPTVYVSISSKKTPKPSEDSSQPPEENPLPVPPSEETAAPIPKLILSAGVNQKTGTPLSKRERRKKSDNLNYVKPLWDGWYREILWRPLASDPSKRDAEVYYYPPNPPGQKTLRYKTTTELEAFLITSGSMYPISFFTFKKEKVGGPPDWECERDAGAETPERKVATAHALTPTVAPLADTLNTLGKRVSKPPEKLIMETETETPQQATRTSKRAIRAPDKFEADSPSSAQPPAKMARLDPEAARGQSPQKKTETTAGTSGGGGGLKLKTFSKMNAKNQLSGPKGVVCAPMGEEDVLVIDEEAAPSSPGLSQGGMTITKVKKTPGGDTINLPGMPTIGPPPLSYGGPCGVIPVPGQSQPSSISITPLGGQQAVATPRPIAPAPVVTRKIVRPGTKTSVFCSIHCPGVTGFPSLSCTACHCLFHPKCVGVSQSLANNPDTEFYCNDCPPPATPPFPGNLIPVPPPLHLQKPGQGRHPHAPGVSITNNKKQQQQQQQHQHSALRTALTAPQQPRSREPQPPRPFEGQQMISVGGKKFLVIPHPVIESPPPSPPLANQNPGPSAASANQKKARANERASVMLKPADKDSKMPCFDVEMTVDGKYLLVPKDGSNKNLFKDSQDAGTKVSSTSGWGKLFNQNLSYGYAALMEVFKFLSVKERATASKVCRLWRDVSMHHSLWTNISLKNTRIHDWEGFVRFFNNTKSTSLDMRKMLFVKDKDETWDEISAAAPNFVSLTKVELPKVNGPVLQGILGSLPRLESLNAPFVNAPFDVSVLGNCGSLKEVRIKASSGSSLQVTSSLGPLGSLAPRLTHLSLLGLEGLQESDFDVFGTMVQLQLLELGDCSSAPGCFFKTVSELCKLEKLRLEKGSVGVDFAKLSNAPRLKQVELIDFQVKSGFREGLKPVKNIQKLLLIPQYRDEVAKINTEIVEGVTSELGQLTSFYLGVTNEWLEAMVITSGGNKSECFPMLKSGKVEHYSLPALYRLICREMPQCKVKVLKMSAQATCKQFIVNLDQS